MTTSVPVPPPWLSQEEATLLNPKPIIPNLRSSVLIAWDCNEEETKLRPLYEHKGIRLDINGNTQNIFNYIIGDPATGSILPMDMNNLINPSKGEVKAIGALTIIDILLSQFSKIKNAMKLKQNALASYVPDRILTTEAEIQFAALFDGVPNENKQKKMFFDAITQRACKVANIYNHAAETTLDNYDGKELAVFQHQIFNASFTHTSPACDRNNIWP
eukprot:105044_1